MSRIIEKFKNSWLNPLNDKIQKLLTLNERQKKKMAEDNVVLKMRIYVVLAIAFQFILSSWLLKDSEIFWTTLTIYAPLVFLVARGYRIAFVVLILIRTYDSVFLLQSGNNSIISIVLWWAAFCLLYFNALKYENARIQMENSGEIAKPAPKVIRDIFLAVLCFVIAFIGAVFNYGSSFKGNKVDVDLAVVSELAIRNQYGYADFCRAQGYELKVYPQVFNQIFAAQLQKIEQQLPENSNLESFYNVFKQHFPNQLNVEAQDYFSALRQQAIIMLMAKEQGVDPETIIWNDNMSGIMSYKDVCQYLDENADEIITSLDGGLSLLDSYSF